MAAMVNPMISPLQVKDSRWLTLEVCREFTRNKCTRSETDCKFAHPPPHVEVQNGRVTCCFDSIKGKCQRKDPPCKYLHPPQHLREQLLQNGRNNLILKNLQMQAMAAGLPPMVPGMMPAMVCESNGAKPVTYQQPAAVLQGQYPVMAAHPYIMQQTAYNPYHMGATIPVQGVAVSPVENSSAVSASGQIIATQPKVARADRLEGMTVPGVIPMMKRPAMDTKSGIPMYQPGTGTATYQQAALSAMHLQQPFGHFTIAGQPPGVPRF